MLTKCSCIITTYCCTTFKKKMNKIDNPHILSLSTFYINTTFAMARGDGFEPPFTDSKSVVLPLDDPRKISVYTIRISYSQSDLNRCYQCEKLASWTRLDDGSLFTIFFFFFHLLLLVPPIRFERMRFRLKVCCSTN